MIFRSLSIRNFMSLGRARVRLDNRGLILVTGENRDNPSSSSNGAGKSALWDALCWVLYGKPVRNVPADGVLNGQGGARVALRFESGGKQWKLVRTRGIKSSPTLDLYCAGKNVSGHSQLQTQKMIEPMLGMDFNSFCTSVVFGQETLRFARMTDKDRKAILEKLLGLEIYEQACMLARQEAAGQKLNMDLQHASYMKAKERLSEGRSKLKEGKERLAKDCKAVRISIKKAKRTLAELETERVVDDRKCQKVEHRLEVLRTVAEVRQTCLRELAFYKERYERLNEEVQEIQAKIISIKDSEAPVCPTCSQHIKDQSRKKAIAVLTKERDELSERMKKVDYKYKKYAAKKPKGKESHLRHNRLQARLEAIRARMAERDGKINSISLQISMVKKTPSFAEGALEEIRKRIRQAKKELRGYKKDVQVLEHKMELTKFWIEAFGHHGIRSYLLDEVIPFLNERAQNYSRILTDGRIKIRFKTTDKKKDGEALDKLVVLAKNKDGSLAYEGNSAGERQRIDLCVALALKDLARSRSQSRLNLAVFDEVFESLDESGCERVISLLNEEKENLGTCFVITHNDSLKPYFSKRIRAVKENGISTVGA